MIKFLLITAGGILSFIGVLLFISPIPLGFIFLAPGLAMLISGSDSFAKWVRRRRAKHDGLNEKLQAAEDMAPDAICEPLRKTEPSKSS